MEIRKSRRREATDAKRHLNVYPVAILPETANKKQHIHNRQFTKNPFAGVVTQMEVLLNVSRLQCYSGFYIPSRIISESHV